jgi:hypothetical protein
MQIRWEFERKQAKGFSRQESHPKQAPISKKSPHPIET